MSHDQLFKAVLQAYFRDFLQLFYPNIAENLDFKTLYFMDKEVLSESPEGQPQVGDILAGIRTREGSPRMFLVHIEIEADWRRAFAKRMFHYYAALLKSHQFPIVPMVVYLRGGRKGLVKEEYRISHFGEEHLLFHYYSVRLAKLDAGSIVGGEPLWVQRLRL